MEINATFSLILKTSHNFIDLDHLAKSLQNRAPRGATENGTQPGQIPVGAVRRANADATQPVRVRWPGYRNLSAAARVAADCAVCKPGRDSSGRQSCHGQTQRVYEPSKRSRAAYRDAGERERAYP